jgi:hypothetical protein
MDKYLININNEQIISKEKFRKIIFINNAIENGWTVKKNNGYYVFTKEHNNIKKYKKKKYIEQFLYENVNLHS